MKKIKPAGILFLEVSLLLIFCTPGPRCAAIKGERKALINFKVSMPEPSNHLFHVEAEYKNIEYDTVYFKLPVWIPGYYQKMDYPQEVKDFNAKTDDGRNIPFIKSDFNSWRIIKGRNNSVKISYDIISERTFVANNFLDTTHGYIIPAATFMFIDGYLDSPVRIKIIPYKTWENIATGLEKVDGTTNEFSAPDFDILYDSPFLVGNLAELPSFSIKGIKHRFIAYDPGTFDRAYFISELKKAVEAGTELIGDIPYDEYTFIGIGPGYGGIEHLNNTTVSFSGNGLEKANAVNRMIKFLVHEYFHNYNVKRIRPFELGPFDYSRENRTNLLWVSEGLTVYYEYLLVRRAGVINDDDLLQSIEENINAFENDPGRNYQSLAQASYNTWYDGPFGNRKGEPDRSISYYDKGPVVGLILDLAIRNATQNRKSLDDVIRYLYWNYYKKLQRGFTDAEFQQACEDIAGTSLTSVFEYVYTTKEIDYPTYLAYAGLKISEVTDRNSGRRKFSITRSDNRDMLQISIFQSWTGK